MQERVQEAQQKRSAIDDFGVRRVGEAGNKLGMQDAVDESRNGKGETDERTCSADVKQGAVGQDWRANQDEGPEGAVQVGEGNEKRIGGANMMIAAGKEMTQFVREKNGEQGESKRQACGEAEGVFVKKRERAEKFVEREGFVLSVGSGELCAGDEARAKREEEEDTSKNQHLPGRTIGDRGVADATGGSGAPIHVHGNGWRRVFWEWCAHEVAGVTFGIVTCQYSTIVRVRARAEALRQSYVWSDCGFAATGLIHFFFFFDALKLFAGLEADGLARRNAHLFPGAGIAADAGLARLHTEDAEAAEFDALAAAESLLQRLENSLNGLLGFGAADVRSGDDGIYDIELDHAILPRFRGRC